jgi:hypothetical protein
VGTRAAVGRVDGEAAEFKNGESLNAHTLQYFIGRNNPSPRQTEGKYSTTLDGRLHAGKTVLPRCSPAGLLLR